MEDANEAEEAEKFTACDFQATRSGLVSRSFPGEGNGPGPCARLRSLGLECKERHTMRARTAPAILGTSPWWVCAKADAKNLSEESREAAEFCMQEAKLAVYLLEGASRCRVTGRASGSGLAPTWGTAFSGLGGPPAQAWLAQVLGTWWSVQSGAREDVSGEINRVKEAKEHLPKRIAKGQSGHRAVYSSAGEQRRSTWRVPPAC
ncbi:hypothetical protein CYMTET_16486 [Cymbomonas tetramitiformis]|uniref:Uncharacterized protein n=1 Tax=Cymbomonas tetramitiformis TaxID=36881 RepID=A0AAE0GCG6_9CHLO|nr:hypothetical protein CYMTET_16486 [Cymbomonas tetramitiformis]